jgi:hypothetical protein
LPDLARLAAAWLARTVADLTPSAALPRGAESGMMERSTMRIP